MKWTNQNPTELVDSELQKRMAAIPSAPFDANAAATARAGPLMQALTDRENALIDPTRRSELGTWADMGRGLSGNAQVGITNALGNLHADYEGKRQGALSDALGAVNNEHFQQLQLDQAKEAARTAQQNAKSSRFLGLF